MCPGQFNLIAMGGFDFFSALSASMLSLPEDLHSLDGPPTDTGPGVRCNSTEVPSNALVTDATIVRGHLNRIAPRPGIRLPQSLLHLLHHFLPALLFDCVLAHVFYGRGLLWTGQALTERALVASIVRQVRETGRLVTTA